MFHPAPKIETIVCHASKRILRFLQRRGVITLVTVPGDGKVTVITDESMRPPESTSLHAKSSGSW
jgi:hypothetical protein